MQKKPQKTDSTLEDAVELAAELNKSGVSLSDAAKESARVTGFKKGDIYKELLSRQNDIQGEE